jgi:hypothetical protein
MMHAAYDGAPAGRVLVFDAADLPWQDTPDPGLRLKPVRYDDERGLFLGLVNFAPLARSGLHQHRGVATSFVLDGSLTDFAGPIGLHQAGINLVGATHDAVAYQNTLLVSRLEGPVVYPSSRGDLTGLHAGSRHADFDNPAPEALPDINITVDALVPQQTGIRGVRRQTIFDYARTGSAHRFEQLSLTPGAHVPAWRCRNLTEFWVRGGLLQIDDRVAHANCFVIVEPGAVVRMESPYGALLLAWAEGPEDWLDEAAIGRARAQRSSLFGF